MSRSHYITLGNIFKYPANNYKQDVKDCNDIFKANYPQAEREFRRFNDYIETHSLIDIEEVFGVTFHIQAICFLDMGYVLFGEDYKRGEFLVNMKREQAKINHDCGEELPDNLMHVLALMTISEDDKFIEELAVRIVIPALEKMLKEFDEARSALRKKIMRKKFKAIILENISEGNIYQNALLALYTVMKKDFAGITYDDQKIEQSLSNFIPNCGTCETPEIKEPLKSIPS